MKKIICLLLVLITAFSATVSAKGRSVSRPAASRTVRIVKTTPKPAQQKPEKPSATPNRNVEQQPSTVFRSWFPWLFNNYRKGYCCNKCDCNNLITSLFGWSCKTCGHLKSEHSKRA